VFVESLGHLDNDRVNRRQVFPEYLLPSRSRKMKLPLSSAAWRTLFPKSVGQSQSRPAVAAKAAN
jgi:hypothetical protein